MTTRHHAVAPARRHKREHPATAAPLERAGGRRTRHVLPATGDRLAAFKALLEKGQQQGFVNEEEILALVEMEDELEPPTGPAAGPAGPRARGPPGPPRPPRPRWRPSTPCGRPWRTPGSRSWTRATTWSR